MHKKILGICAALVALGALVLPATASALTLTEHTAGGVVDKVEVGKQIDAIGEEESIFAGGELTVKCSVNTITADVVKNDGTTVEGTITKASFKGAEAGEKCNGGALLGATAVKIPALETEGKDWCLKNVAGEDEFEVFGRKCGGTETSVLTFILEGSIKCIYKREAASVRGTFTTTTTPATLSVTGSPSFSKETGSNILCPATGTITKMKFNLYTDTETEAKSTEDPLSLDDIV